MDRGLIHGKVQGLFSKSRSEGVSSFLGRRSRDRRLRTVPGGNGGGLAIFLHPCAAPPWPEGLELAGVIRLPDSVHQNSSRAYGKKEKLTADSPRRSVRADWNGEVLVAVEDVRGFRRDPNRVV